MLMLPFKIVIYSASFWLVSFNFLSAWFVLLRIMPMLPITMPITSPILYSTWPSSSWINFLYFSCFSCSRCWIYSFDILYGQVTSMIGQCWFSNIVISGRTNSRPILHDRSIHIFLLVFIFASSFPIFLTRLDGHVSLLSVHCWVYIYLRCVGRHLVLLCIAYTSLVAHQILP